MFFRIIRNYNKCFRVVMPEAACFPALAQLERGNRSANDACENWHQGTNGFSGKERLDIIGFRTRSACSHFARIQVLGGNATRLKLSPSTETAENSNLSLARRISIAFIALGNVGASKCSARLECRIVA